MSHWTVPKLEAMMALGVAVMALQETHLAAVPLEWARSAARRCGAALHAGKAVPAVANTVHGRSCGVAFLAAAGVAVSPVPPRGTAWRMLHACGRLHAVQLPPRPGLPAGLLLLSVYAPVTARQERARFDAAVLEVVHQLDMQQPVVLLGDFNGSVDPQRDYAGGMRSVRSVCPLLAQLLGPGSPLVDLQLAVSPAERAWTFVSCHGSTGASASSRCDLALGNRAAMALTRRVCVHAALRDGGHAPVVLELRLPELAIPWVRPRPRLPPLLRLSSAELLADSRWDALLAEWRATPELQQALDASRGWTAVTLSDALHAALRRLVALAGGWSESAPRRRPAYASPTLQRLRRRLTHLWELEELTQLPPPVGPWPFRLERQLTAVRACGVDLPEGEFAELRVAVCQAIARARRAYAEEVTAMRKVRRDRWRERLPQLWRLRPHTVFRFLRAEEMPWGSSPIMDAAGQQCTTPAEVDAAVRGYWVDEVLRKPSPLDGGARWERFLASPFARHVPRLEEWPTLSWTASRIATVLRTMREGAAPGDFGLALGVWRALPEDVLGVAARLLALIEEEGTWPEELATAYVAMIPKAAGGARPRDQRPITVLQVLYRVWAKGIVLEWAPTLQRQYLGQAAMGFRPALGTTHVVQVVSDLMELQWRRGRELWLLSFDLEKAYDSVPWWALFGVLEQAGVRSPVVRAFRAFYRQLRRRFRYGHVDGGPWHAANGLAQGCPASPDLLNVLLEPFHRWALAAGHGVEAGPARIASLSFADDVVLVASSQAAAQTLVQAYLDWCALLELRVTKTQLWSSVPGASVEVHGAAVEARPTFRVVGVELGLDEKVATELHLSTRLAKATASAERLRVLQLPSAIVGVLWQSVVLAQAVYGCEVRDLPVRQLMPLTSVGRAVLAVSRPLQLSVHRAVEPLAGPPLGDTAFREPIVEARHRQLHWLQQVANTPDLAGTLHRFVGTDERGRYTEPTRALRSALQEAGWQVRRNAGAALAAEWPELQPERPFGGTVTMQATPAAPVADGAVFTDGSIGVTGGASAVQPSTGAAVRCGVPQPRSSTHCELAALCQVARFDAVPEVWTDSLSALQMVARWSEWPSARVLQCTDRVEVRCFLEQWHEHPTPPALHKVKAHDVEALAAGHAAAVGNDLADAAAKEAATGTFAVWQADAVRHGDGVEVVDGSGALVLAVGPAYDAARWERHRRAAAVRRPWMARLYPEGVAMDWHASGGIFRRPTVGDGGFVHAVQPAVLKWIARIRTGALNTRLRLHTADMCDSPACLCCGAAAEDDAHVVAGCPVTGTADVEGLVLDAWRASATSLQAQVPDPPVAWVRIHSTQLMAAMLPVSVRTLLPGLPTAKEERFLRQLHRRLAEQTAERMRRREELHAAKASQAAPPDAQAPRQRDARALSPDTLRRLEVERRGAAAAAPAAEEVAVTADAPPAEGEHRLTWLRRRLLRMLEDDTAVCPAMEGATALELLAQFETGSGQPFTSAPGKGVAVRLAALSRVLLAMVRQRDGQVVPPLQRTEGRTCRFSRRPLHPVDAEAWRRTAEAADAQHRAPAMTLKRRSRTEDDGLPAWLKGHRHLRAVDAQDGEPAAALLLLWEVDHGRDYPTQATNLPDKVLGFSRRLWVAVQKDAELQAWFARAPGGRPLTPGAQGGRMLRYSVRIEAPPDPAAPWWVEFLVRWRAYLATMVVPAGIAPAGNRGARRSAAGRDPGAAASAGPVGRLLDAPVVDVDEMVMGDAPAAAASGAADRGAAVSAAHAAVAGDQGIVAAVADRRGRPEAEPPQKRQRAAPPEPRRPRVRPREAEASPPAPKRRLRQATLSFGSAAAQPATATAALPGPVEQCRHGRAATEPPT